MAPLCLKPLDVACAAGEPQQHRGARGTGAAHRHASVDAWRNGREQAVLAQQQRVVLQRQAHRRDPPHDLPHLQA
eukprot:6401471-Prymnesium_polylepis.1